MFSAWRNNPALDKEKDEDQKYGMEYLRNPI